MTSQPDKLFREKLEHFNKPAPAAAWQKIEAGLDKTDTKGMWMKIAAGLILLAVATILLWPSDDTKNSPLLTNTTPTTEESKITGSQSESTPLITESTTPLSIKMNSQRNSNINKKNRETKKDESVLVVKSIDEINSVSSSQYPVSSIEYTASSIQPQETTQDPEVLIAQTIVEESTSKTIVYTANEVNAKFLKKVSPVEATSDEKKSSSIQKLMGLAYNLKNSETGLGDLRQKKDEILALNFLEKKQAKN